jgi:hypothetical protein
MITPEIAEQLDKAGILKHDFDSLWELLPQFIVDRLYNSMYQWKSNNICGCGYSGIKESHIEHESPTTAVAMLLLWCIKEGHILDK